MSNTRITLHSSGVSGNTPSLGVLSNGEVSLNFADGVLYYKTDSNTLGSIQTTEPSGLDTEIQFNDSGSFGSNSGLTFDKSNSTLSTGNLVVSSNIYISNGYIETNGTQVNLEGGFEVSGVLQASSNVETEGLFVTSQGVVFSDGTTQTTAATGSLESNNKVLTDTTANQVIDIFYSTTYTSAKYVTQAYVFFNTEDLLTEISLDVDLQTSSASAEDLESSLGDKELEMKEVLVLTNGRDSFIKETSNLFSDISLGTYYTDMDGTNVRLLFTPSYVDTTVSVKRISIAA